MALEINEIAIQMQVGDIEDRADLSQPRAAAGGAACCEPEDTVDRAVQRILKALKNRQER